MSIANLIFMFFFGFVCSAPTKNKTHQYPTIKALDFMKQYGYLQMDDGDSEALYTEGGISENIKAMQKFGGINQTGVFDEATERLMTLPRCGVPDIINFKRQKRYILGSQGWEKRNISYFLANWSPQLGEAIVEKSIQKALDQWGSYGRLNFYRKNSQDADIIVLFGNGYHGDNNPFDGPGGILAHAFFPHEWDQLGGDIHFDAAEEWSDIGSDGTDFYTVALHELGHSLGLAHSPMESSIMFPYYQDPQSDIRLGYDDILGMYDLYIRRILKEDKQATTTEYNDELIPTIRPPTWTTTESDETISTSSLNTEYSTYTPAYSDEIPESSTETAYTDEIPESSTETTYIGEFPETAYTSEITESSTEITYTGEFPETTYTNEITKSSTKTTTYFTTSSENVTVTRKTDEDTLDDDVHLDKKHDKPDFNSPIVPDLCDGHLDAVATLRDELFVFTDQYVWRFKDKGKLIEGYPVKLSDVFRNFPDNIKKIDAAYERPDGMIVLFTGNMFWVYDGESFLESSPKPLTYYGLPEYVTNIDAVQSWDRNKKTYFYKADRYWRYNETTRQMDNEYPQHMNHWRGVPPYLDSATTWRDGITYFFRSGLFWKFDNTWVTVTEESPFPTPTIWFGCSEERTKLMKWFWTES